MTGKLLTGPLLGIESDQLYTVCFLTGKTASSASVTVGGSEVDAQLISDTAKGRFWRAELNISLPPAGHYHEYRIWLDDTPAVDQHYRDSWRFYVPAETEKPLIAYCSCNGFSSPDILNKTDRPYALWEDMQRRHQTAPYSLLLMGGDQLYADEIWSRVESLQSWAELPLEDKRKRSFTQTMQSQTERFYDRLYQQRWQNEAMSLMLASVPSVMMWDDHDIFDGWGSFPETLQTCPVYQGIYAIARHYFELFQIRSNRNQSLLDAGSAHYAFGFKFRGSHILALDNRAERSREQVMSQAQWQAVTDYLNQQAREGELLVMSAVPVVYRDFSLTEASFDATPWEEELTDDLKDHWRAKEHQGERARLIMRLLDNARARSNGQHRTVILSGDVHLGCLGVITDTRQPQTIKVHQVVSSGIVHPSPSRIAWFGIMAVTNDRDEYLNEEKTIHISMLTPFGSNRYIRSRNYVSLQEGTDNKLWVNWLCENQDQPEYPLE